MTNKKIRPRNPIRAKNKEIESIYWDNGIDLCPDVLYAIGRTIGIIH